MNQHHVMEWYKTLNLWYHFIFEKYTVINSNTFAYMRIYKQTMYYTRGQTHQKIKYTT